MRADGHILIFDLSIRPGNAKRGKEGNDTSLSLLRVHTLGRTDKQLGTDLERDSHIRRRYGMESAHCQRRLATKAKHHDVCVEEIGHGWRLVAIEVFDRASCGALWQTESVPGTPPSRPGFPTPCWSARLPPWNSKCSSKTSHVWSNSYSGAEAKRVDKGCLRGKLEEMKVSLPSALEDFVSSQVKSGEFDDASEVVGEALRLLREARESKAMEEMRTAFTGVDSFGGKGEPTAKDRALIAKLIRTRRSDKRRA